VNSASEDARTSRERVTELISDGPLAVASRTPARRIHARNGEAHCTARFLPS